MNRTSEPSTVLSRASAWITVLIVAGLAPGCGEGASKDGEETGGSPDTDTGTPDSAAEDSDSDPGADTDSGVSTDTDTDTDTDTGAETGTDTDPDTAVEGPLYTWPELSLAEAELEFASTWTNGPCPTDTLFDDPLAHWDYLDPTNPYVDYYPALQDAWGETVWYGRDVWKVQFTVLELAMSYDTYSSTVETRYFVCADDGVRLAGIEAQYADPEYSDYRITLYDPPPLYLPADRTEGETWSEEYAWSAYWWNGRAYPDSGYESGSGTLTGTMGHRGALVVPAGTFEAQAVVVDGQESWWADGEGLVRLNGDELVVRSAR